MKYIHLNALFLMVIFHTACGQKQTEPHKDNIYSEPKDIVASYGPGKIVRKIIQDGKGNIWMASWEGQK